MLRDTLDICVESLSMRGRSRRCDGPARAPPWAGTRYMSNLGVAYRFRARRGKHTIRLARWNRPIIALRHGFVCGAAHASSDGPVANKGGALRLGGCRASSSEVYPDPVVCALQVIRRCASSSGGSRGDLVAGEPIAPVSRPEHRTSAFMSNVREP